MARARRNANNRRINRNPRRTQGVKRPQKPGGVNTHGHPGYRVINDGSGTNMIDHTHQHHPVSHTGTQSHMHQVQPYNIEFMDGTSHHHTHESFPNTGPDDIGAGAHGANSPFGTDGQHAHPTQPWIGFADVPSADGNVTRQNWSHTHQPTTGNPTHDGAHTHAAGSVRRKGGRVKPKRKMARGGRVKPKRKMARGGRTKPKPFRKINRGRRKMAEGGHTVQYGTCTVGTTTVGGGLFPGSTSYHVESNNCTMGSSPELSGGCNPTSFGVPCTCTCVPSTVTSVTATQQNRVKKPMSRSNVQRRMINRTQKPRRNFQTGGTTYQNSGCRMHTSKYDCDSASGCSWDFNNTCCH